MTRKEAQSKQLNKYPSDKPCQRGHQKWRYTQTGLCVECVAGHARKRQEDLSAFKQFRNKNFIKIAFRAPLSQVETLKEFANALGAECLTPPTMANVAPPAPENVLAPPYVPRHPMQPVQMPPPPII